MEKSRRPLKRCPTDLETRNPKGIIFRASSSFYRETILRGTAYLAFVVDRCGASFQAGGSIECLVGIFEEDSLSRIFDCGKSTFLSFFLLFFFGRCRISGAFKKDLRDLRILWDSFFSFNFFFGLKFSEERDY